MSEREGKRGMNLYEIEAGILSCIDEETGEIIDLDRLNELEMERDTKVENIALWIKNLKAEIGDYAEEEQAFRQRRKTAENKMESLKRYLSGYLNGEKFKTTKVSCSFRSSTSVEVDDMSILPEEYKRYREPEPMKTEIKEAINKGVDVPGAALVSNLSLIIK